MTVHPGTHSAGAKAGFVLILVAVAAGLVAAFDPALVAAWLVRHATPVWPALALILLAVIPAALSLSLKHR
jgi:hypothetical protein